MCSLSFSHTSTLISPSLPIAFHHSLTPFISLSHSHSHSISPPSSLSPFPTIPPCPSFLLSLPPSLSHPLTPALYPTSPLSPSLPLLTLAHLFLDDESSRHVRELGGDNVAALSMVGRWLMITVVKRAPFNCVLVHRFSSWRSWMYWLLELCWYTHKIQHLSLSLPHYPSM